MTGRTSVLPRLSLSVPLPSLISVSLFSLWPSPSTLSFLALGLSSSGVTSLLPRCLSFTLLLPCSLLSLPYSPSPWICLWSRSLSSGDTQNAQWLARPSLKLRSRQKCGEYLQRFTHLSSLTWLFVAFRVTRPIHALKGAGLISVALLRGNSSHVLHPPWRTHH